MQLGGSGEIDAHHLPLSGADGRQVIVAAQRLKDVRGCHAVGRKPCRVEPGAQRKLPAAEDLRILDTRHGIELRFDHARQIVGDAVGWQDVAAEAHVSGIDRLADGDVEHRLLRLRRQLVTDGGDLRLDLGERAVGVVVEAQRRGDGRESIDAGRGEVVDPLRLGDRLLERLGDETGHRVGIRAVVGSGHGDHGVLGLRILAHRQLGERAHAEHQNQRADHDR